MPALEPAQIPPRKRRKRVVRQGTETSVVSGISADEKDTDWAASSTDSTDSNDAQLLRDVPPHWGGGRK